MIRITIVLLALSSPAFAQSPSLGICHGEFALCAAASTEPTNRNIVVKGVTFREGHSVCPVLRGPSIADLGLMNGSCATPKGKVWSLFSARSKYPQAPDWKVKTAVHRAFTTTAAPGGGMSNMWSFPCVVRPTRVNGHKLADCYGPMNESPWTTTAIGAGVKIVTDAPAGAPNPVGGNIP